jgi:DNA polymerase elongation subunit (family B)
MSNQTINKLLETNRTIIATYDVECKSADGIFPQPTRNGDEIVQINVALSRSGESYCYERIVLRSGVAVLIEGVEVRRFESERDLLMGFIELMQQKNPDVVAEYNVIGGYSTEGNCFKYLVERAGLLGI